MARVPTITASPCPEVSICSPRVFPLVGQPRARAPEISHVMSETGIGVKMGAYHMGTGYNQESGDGI